jgi:hypothetical protein
MAEFDFPAWIERARAFAIGIGHLPGGVVRSTIVAVPVDESAMHRIEGALGRRVAASLRAFFTRGAAALDCGYSWAPDGRALDGLHALLPDETQIFGGARLGPISELPDYLREAADWANDTWVADTPDQRSIWDTALPFLRLDNGDYLALDLRNGDTEPPVAYLNHDDDSFLLAPNLVAFFTAWERLCYLGPEHWLLGAFIGDAGYLDTESERAARLRALLGREPLR